MEKNYGAVLHKPFDLRIEQLSIPEIKDNELLVEMRCVGICGSDVHLYSTGRCGLEALSRPILMGHEGAGVVSKVGGAVRGFSVGDRVAVEPTAPCRACDACRGGRYNVCARPAYCATSDAPGNLCRYYAHVADFCHKIPDNLTFEEGAAAQPLAIAFHACRRAGVALGTVLCVLGAGPVGLLCALAARAMGASKVLVADLVESRLKTAREMDVERTLLLQPGYDEEATAEEIAFALGERPGVTIDACGAAAAQGVAMKVTRDCGVVLVVGIGAARVTVPLAAALLREVDVRGSYRSANAYPAALAAASQRSVDLSRFISHRLPLQRAAEAMELARSGAAMKVIVTLTE